MTDPFDLDRFVQAQEQVYSRVVAELSGGRKQSHWMWFIFPQVTGLGFSAMSQRYAILGAPDDAKFRSSMTLFAAVSDKPIFAEAITKYFAGGHDHATLDILAKLDRAPQ